MVVGDLPDVAVVKFTETFAVFEVTVAVAFSEMIYSFFHYAVQAFQNNECTSKIYINEGLTFTDIIGSSDRGAFSFVLETSPFKFQTIWGNYSASREL